MNREEIKQWLDRYGVRHYTINNDLTVDVDGSVWLYKKSLTEIPFKFGVINGSFDFPLNNLTSLKGCPDIVHGSFDCSYNNLTSLDGCPQVVNGSFYCRYNKLTSLEGCPEVVNGRFDCMGNKLTSLENSSNISWNIYLDNEIEGFKEYYDKGNMCYVVPANVVKAYYLHKRLSQIVPEVTKTTKKVKL